MIKLCRYQGADGTPRAGVLTEGGVRELPSGTTVTSFLEDLAALKRIDPAALPLVPGPRLLAPVDRQEVWAAGVTYLRSKRARMDESDFSASAYDKVYEAPRPEIFFKSMPHKARGPGAKVGIRRDARWNVPEPELALVINSRRELAGFTIGNDMSSRDIEGENLLYLPQGKIYDGSCALGPCIVVGPTEAEARLWNIDLKIARAGDQVFAGTTSVSQIKRNFGELIEYLCRSQSFPHGAILLTGTGIVPGDDFTLRPGDQVRIEISGVGVLENEVEEV